MQPVRTPSVKRLHLHHDFRPGTYSLQGQGFEYFYFRSPVPLEIRIFASRKVERKMAGSLMLAKSPLRHVWMPAAGYADNDGRAGGKLRAWKLGVKFMRLSGET
jgi:hypothetical protein